MQLRAAGHLRMIERSWGYRGHTFQFRLWVALAETQISDSSVFPGRLIIWPFGISGYVFGNGKERDKGLSMSPKHWHLQRMIDCSCPLGWLWILGEWVAWHWVRAEFMLPHMFSRESIAACVWRKSCSETPLWKSLDSEIPSPYILMFP